MNTPMHNKIQSMPLIKDYSSKNRYIKLAHKNIPIRAVPIVPYNCLTKPRPEIHLSAPVSLKTINNSHHETIIVKTASQNLRLTFISINAMCINDNKMSIAIFTPDNPPVPINNP